MFDNLEAEQKRKRMTNSDVAEILGISRVSYEKKKKNGAFSRPQITTLCKVFGCTFEYLFQTSEDQPA